MKVQQEAPAAADAAPALIDLINTSKPPTTTAAGVTPTATAARCVKVLTAEQVEEAATLLANSAMFNACTEAQRRAVAQRMEPRTYKRNEDITKQGDPVDRFWVMAAGYARRLRTEEDGAQRHVNSSRCGNAISSLSVIEGAKTYATARCMSGTGCRAYSMARDDLLDLLDKDSALHHGVTMSLAARLRHNLHTRTPLLQQKGTEINYTAVCIAAALESYPRSALNSVLNQRLTGVSGALLPNMHVQIPVRVFYIAGFKGLRSTLDKNVHIDELPNHPTRVAARLGVAIAPGLLMTPFSSLLEASNAGHSNPEPLLQRSLRGTSPRMVREVLFGIGLNQMSDYFAERWRSVISSSSMATAVGSVTAGVVSGYLSHVPHNISTLRLLNPSWSYSKIFRAFVDKSAPAHLVPAGLPVAAHQPLRTVMACLIPRGVIVRTTQICVSFVVLNSAIKFIEREQDKKLIGIAQAADEDL